VLQAVSSASTECISSGNAYGCGAAFAYAKAWAIATASAHAEAFSLAINECNCRDHDQQVIASDYGSADSFKKLVAEVEATAKAQVCVSGNASAKASVVASCQQGVYANVFAKVCLLSLPLIVCRLSTLLHAHACGEAMPVSVSLWPAITKGRTVPFVHKCMYCWSHCTRYDVHVPYAV
jgi:hypothetical protein